MQNQKLGKSRSLSSTEGEENRIYILGISLWTILGGCYKDSGKSKIAEIEPAK